MSSIKPKLHEESINQMLNQQVHIKLLGGREGKWMNY